MNPTRDRNGPDRANLNRIYSHSTGIVVSMAEVENKSATHDNCKGARYHAGDEKVACTCHEPYDSCHQVGEKGTEPNRQGVGDNERTNAQEEIVEIVPEDNMQE